LNFEDENKDLLEKDERDWTTLDYIRWLCGRTVAVKIKAHYCGIEFKVPANANDTNKAWNELVEVLGRQDALAFVKNFNGEVFYIPFGKEQKKHRIIKLVRQGQKNTDIARTCQVSERYVRMVKNQVANLAT
jgi:hypothetical protein